jgi:hypothetical protein
MGLIENKFKASYDPFQFRKDQNPNSKYSPTKNPSHPKSGDSNSKPSPPVSCLALPAHPDLPDPNYRPSHKKYFKYLTCLENVIEYKFEIFC